MMIIHTYHFLLSFISLFSIIIRNMCMIMCLKYQGLYYFKVSINITYKLNTILLGNEISASAIYAIVHLSTNQRKYCFDQLSFKDNKSGPITTSYWLDFIWFWLMFVSLKPGTSVLLTIYKEKSWKVGKYQE